MVVMAVVGCAGGGLAVGCLARTRGGSFQLIPTPTPTLQIWDEELKDVKRDANGLAERADEKLNKAVVAALEMVEAKAEQHGWKTIGNYKELYPDAF